MLGQSRRYKFFCFPFVVIVFLESQKSLDMYFFLKTYDEFSYSISLFFSVTTWPNHMVYVELIWTLINASMTIICIFLSYKLYLVLLNWLSRISCIVLIPSPFYCKNCLIDYLYDLSVRHLGYLLLHVWSFTNNSAHRTVWSCTFLWLFVLAFIVSS
jgi:hypothetical protein